ncbi:MAG: asparagine synthase (glutamine-hydrolyzing), partial [Actinomycetota bacterium]|nr:asparagine synthase (glutamine-hydrolyzing) [Actinomycetota bacterium]MDA3025791.1 asparagine synthase (glutamine-hydrolyzing) [Actinomycetota bacterium]
SPDGSVAFGHRRLSIVDLSPAGHQPMTSRNGAWTITYNGELYNTAEIRSQLSLSSTDLRGHSDTEVLVEAISRWGVEAAVGRVVGMFAFAAYDHQSGDVWLARDRFGEKPLYYQARKDTLAFASELSAVMSLPGPRPDIDRGALSLLLRHGFIPAPHSIFDGVRKLPAGHILRVSGNGHVSEPICYWNPIDEALGAPKHTASERELIDELEELLTRTVTSRTVSDVPLGAFLSGGIDSSLVVALMSRASTQPPRTFTIGFDETAYDESAFAKGVARHLGTDHTELIVSEADALAVVPRLGKIYSEPFADSSQIPTRLVSELARRSVTVALSGDGGDEFFGGYDRYRVMARLSRIERRTPAMARRAVARTLLAPSVSTWDRVATSPIGRVAPRLTARRPGQKAHKLGRLLASDSHDLYRTLMSDNDQPDDLLLNGFDHGSYRNPIPSDTSPANRAMLLDTLTYLPEDLLTKVDRASMSVSLEVRVPLLDPEVFRFAWGLPDDSRIRNGQGKWILRQVLARHVPTELFERPKMGFGVPLGRWLSGPLQSWATDLLDPSALRVQGYLQGDEVSALWHDHTSGRTDRSAQLWPILMFQTWLDEWSL